MRVEGMFDGFFRHFLLSLLLFSLGRFILSSSNYKITLITMQVSSD
jgi:hypothetical protein